MRKYISVVLAFMLVLSVGIGFRSATLANEREKSEWPMFMRNPEHTGEIGSKYAPKSNMVTKLWSFKADDTIYSSPSIVNDKVYFGSLDRNMYCLDADSGKEQWIYRVKEPIRSSPSVYKDNVYFGSLDGRFHCVDSDGDNVWTFDTKKRGGMASSPLISGGCVIFGTLDGYLMCVTDKGDQEVWRFEYDDALTSSPALSNGSVVVGARDFELLCIDEFSGEKIWQRKLDGSIYSSASIMDNYVYVGCDKNKIYCLDLENGDIVWDVDTVQGVRSTPALSGKYVVFSSGNFIYCLSQENGETVWKYDHQGQGFSSMTISGEKVYASMGSQLLCLDIDTGYKIWEEDLESEAFAPSIAYNRIYIGTKAGYMHCFVDDTLPFDVSISPSVLNFGAVPPRSPLTGTISVSMPPSSDVENNPETIIDFKTDSDWFSLISEGNAVSGDKPLEISVAIDDGILSEDQKWYSDEIVFSIADVEYKVFVKVYTDSSLEFAESGEIVIDKSGCSWVSENCNAAGDSNATEFCGPEGDVLSKVWEEEFGDSLNNCVLVAHGFAFVMPSYTRDIYCYDVDNGELVWEVEIDNYINDSGALFGGGLYIPTNSGVTAISQKDGQELWSFDDGLDICTSLSVANGKAFFGTTDGNVYCLSLQTGVLLWSFRASEKISTGIAISPGSIFFGSNDKKLYCVELETGDEVWDFEIKDPLVADPVYIDGKVVVAARNKRLFLLDAGTGEQIWFTNTLSEARITPACNDEYIYLITKDTYIRCYIMETGELKWGYETKKDIEVHPTISGGRLYFGTWDKEVFCLDTVTGIPLWSYETESKVRSPIVVSGGNVFVSSGRKLICFSDPPPDIIISPDLIDFGGISTDSDGTIIRELTLENTTDATLFVQFTTDINVEWIVPVTTELTIEPKHKETAVVALDSAKIPGGMPSGYLYVSWNESVVPIIVRAYTVERDSIQFADWFAFGFDQSRNSSVIPSFGPETKKLETKWRYDTFLETDASPVINKEKLFLGFGNTFYCIDPKTGEYVWSEEFDREGFSSAGSCAGIGGQSIYFGSSDSHMYSYDVETGERNWKFKTGGPVFSSPSVHEKRFEVGEPVQRRVYFGSLDNNIYCVLAETGELVWEFETEGSVYSSVCTPPYGDLIFVGSVDDYIYAIDTLSGEEVWKYKTGGSIYSTPCCFVYRSTGIKTAFDLNIYIGSNDGTLYCLDGVSGKLIWKYETDSPIVCSPALHDGKIFFGNLKGDFYALNRATGDKIKMVKLGSQIRSSPALSARNCYISTKNGRFFKLDSDTLEVLWYTTIGSGCSHFQSSPAIWGKKVYVGDRDGVLHCFGEKAAEIEFDKTTVDFGRVPKGSLKTQKVMIKNNSESEIELHFEDAYEWFDIDNTLVNIEPGEEIPLTIMTKSSELNSSGSKYGGIWVRWYSPEDEMDMEQRISVLVTVN